MTIIQNIFRQYTIVKTIKYIDLAKKASNNTKKILKVYIVLVNTIYKKIS